MKSNTGRYGEEIRMTQYYYSDGYFYKTPTGFGTVFNKYEPEYEKILTEDNKPVYYTTGTAYVYDYRPLKISIENMKVRPVINLKNTARISGGEGTKDNPFTLKFE